MCGAFFYAKIVLRQKLFWRNQMLLSKNIYDEKKIFGVKKF